MTTMIRASNRVFTLECLIRGDDGLCRRARALQDADGVPVTDYGYEFARTGQTTLRGWGELDGPAEVWSHAAGAYDLLVPVNRSAPGKGGS